MNNVTKVMSVSIITNTFLSLIKIIIGFICKSSALLADGVHSFSDLLTDFFAIIGNIMAKKPADEKHPYGHGKIEYLTSIGISIVVIILGLTIINNSMHSKVVMSSLIVSIVSLITITLKYLLSEYIIRKGKKLENNILIASGKESRADVISSLVVFISAILSVFSKYIEVFKYSDKIAGIIVGILIIRTGFLILKENISIILGEQEIKGETLNKIRKIILNNKDIKTIDELIILKFGHCYKVSMEVSMNPDLTLLECHTIVDELEKKLKKEVEKIEYITVHVNPYHKLEEFNLTDACDDNKDFIFNMVEKLTPKKDISNYVNKHLKDTKIIKKNDQVIGGVIYYKENSRYLLDLIYIKDKYQNLGIGHNIIKNLIDNQKKNKTQLEVLKSNIKAIKLYKNLGFQIISETKNKYIMEVN
jgi:cation diffusion facilitator family transporter